MVSPAAARLRTAMNWVNLSTPLGLLVARLGGARIQRGDDGLWWAESYRFGFPVAGAFTVGDVVITARRLDDLSDDVRAHEARHSWQWMVCGTTFLPLYTAAMGWSWLTTGDRAAGNVFERAAGLTTGGYVDPGLRPTVKRWVARLSS